VSLWCRRSNSTFHWRHRTTMHLRTFLHIVRRGIRVALAIVTPSLVLAACSSGTRTSLHRASPSPQSQAGERATSKRPTWVAHDGAYEIVAYDMRDIVAVQPLIEREYETFRAIHGAAPRRVQFVVRDDDFGGSVAAREGDLRDIPLGEGMERVTISVAAIGARAVVGAWRAPRTSAEARP
jgi:hypothetical protein